MNLVYESRLMIQPSKLFLSLFKDSITTEHVAKKKRISLPILNEHHNTLTEHMTILTHHYVAQQNIVNKNKSNIIELQVIRILGICDRFTSVIATKLSLTVTLVIPNTLLHNKSSTITLKNGTRILIDSINCIDLDNFSIISSDHPFRYIDDNTIM